MTPDILLVECDSIGVTVKLNKGCISLVGEATAVKKAVAIARPYKSDLITYLSNIEHFRLSAMNSTPIDEFELEQIRRTNNMTFEFMSFDCTPFDVAIRMAREIVTHQKIVPCEASYANVDQLINRIKK